MSSTKENIIIGDRILINLDNNFQEVEILAFNYTTEQYSVKILSETNKQKRHIDYDVFINHCLPIFDLTIIKYLNAYFIKQSIDVRIVQKMNSGFEVQLINDKKSSLEINNISLNNLVSILKLKICLYDCDLLNFLYNYSTQNL